MPPAPRRALRQNCFYISLRKIRFRYHTILAFLAEIVKHFFPVAEKLTQTSAYLSQMRVPADVSPRIRLKKKPAAPGKTLLCAIPHIRRAALFVIVCGRANGKIVGAQPLHSPHVRAEGTVEHAVRLLPRADAPRRFFCRARSIAALPSGTSVRIHAVKEHNGDIRAPAERRRRPERAPPPTPAARYPPAPSGAGAGRRRPAPFRAGLQARRHNFTAPIR